MAMSFIGRFCLVQLARHLDHGGSETIPLEKALGQVVENIGSGGRDRTDDLEVMKAPCYSCIDLHRVTYL
jgi:hypothetical protein